MDLRNKTFFMYGVNLRNNSNIKILIFEFEILNNYQIKYWTFDGSTKSEFNPAFIQYTLYTTHSNLKISNRFKWKFLPEIQIF